MQESVEPDRLMGVDAVSQAGRSMQATARSERTDSELVRATLAGNRAAFGMLIERYWKPVFVWCRQKVGNQQDAEDIAQEAFVKAYRGLSGLRDACRFAGWLYHIARRRSIDHLRERGRLSTLSLERLSEQRVQLEAAPATRECPEPVSDMLEALERLPDRYRLVILMRYYQELSYKEISERLGEPIGTVSNRLHRAGRLLRERMERHRSTTDIMNRGSTSKGDDPEVTDAL